MYNNANFLYNNLNFRELSTVSKMEIVVRDHNYLIVVQMWCKIQKKNRKSLKIKDLRFKMYPEPGREISIRVVWNWISVSGAGSIIYCESML